MFRELCWKIIRAYSSHGMHVSRQHLMGGLDLDLLLANLPCYLYFKLLAFSFLLCFLGQLLARCVHLLYSWEKPQPLAKFSFFVKLCKTFIDMILLHGTDFLLFCFPLQLFLNLNFAYTHDLTYKLSLSFLFRSQLPVLPSQLLSFTSSIILSNFFSWVFSSSCCCANTHEIALVSSHIFSFVLLFLTTFFL